MINEAFLNNFRKTKIYQKRLLKFDLVAGIVVCLVAIPLCLGIALASGAPILSGIISGIIGGIVVGALSGSQVSVSGPAAGMAAVVVTAIAQLGDFNTFLLALTIAGLFQMFLGSLKAGSMVEYVPSNVIQGLLCAIGLLLIVKQLPLAFTHSTDLKQLKEYLLDSTEGFTINPFYQFYSHINLGATFITFISFGILIFFAKTKIKFFKPIPAPIIVVIAGILLNELFISISSPLQQGYVHLVNIPSHDNIPDFLKQLEFPNWDAWLNHKVYMYAFIISIVTSLETLLNIKAGEKLDNKHRGSSKDRELFAQGVGNFFAGLVGGIPITSVIVRTSVNIQAGSKTKMAAIFHGLLLLSAVLLIPNILNRIPLSSLAAILIYTGYKLTKPSIYRSIYKQGLDRFIPFIATVLSIVLFNLLAGILIGLSISLFYILKSNSQARLDIINEIYPTGATNRLILPQQTTFLNKASLIEELNAIPRNSQLIIDARYATFIDKEIIEFLKEFQEEQAPNRQIALNLMGFQDHYDIHNYINFINVTTFDVQSSLTPQKVLNVLREGNQRFLNDTCIHRSNNMDIKYTAETQHPIAIILGCIDSRVPVESIFDMSFGDLFIVRIAGNVVNEDILASIEYACHFVGAKLIIVLGHSRCGAIGAACDGVAEGHMTKLLAKIGPALKAEKNTIENRNSTNKKFVSEITSMNIANTIHNIYDESKILKAMIDKNEVGIIGAKYHVESGEVVFSDYLNELEALCYQHSAQLSHKMKSVLEQTPEKDTNTNTGSNTTLN